MSFKNKTVIITGAAQGIGFEIAKQLSKEGANIVLNDIDEKLGLGALEVLNQLGGQSVLLAGNCGDIAVIEQLISKAIENFGQLDIIIANAGITTYGPFLEYTKEALDKLLHVNIQGTFFLAQLGAKQFMKQKSVGKILMISSVTGVKPHDDLEAYGMTKAAIIFLAQTLGTQLAPLGINVNSICPGATATERTTSNEKWAKGWAEQIPTKRVAEVQDIAAAALFLVSEKSRQITGQNLSIDGGWLNVGPFPQDI